MLGSGQDLVGTCRDLVKIWSGSGRDLVGIWSGFVEICRVWSGSRRDLSGCTLSEDLIDTDNFAVADVMQLSTVGCFYISATRVR